MMSPMDRDTRGGDGSANAENLVNRSQHMIDTTTSGEGMEGKPTAKLKGQQILEQWVDETKIILMNISPRGNKWPTEGTTSFKLWIKESVEGGSPPLTADDFIKNYYGNWDNLKEFVFCISDEQTGGNAWKKGFHEVLYPTNKAHRNKILEKVKGYLKNAKSARKIEPLPCGFTQKEWRACHDDLRHDIEEAGKEADYQARFDKFKEIHDRKTVQDIVAWVRKAQSNRPDNIWLPEKVAWNWSVEWAKDMFRNNEKAQPYEDVRKTMLLFVQKTWKSFEKDIQRFLRDFKPQNLVSLLALFLPVRHQVLVQGTIREKCSSYHSRFCCPVFRWIEQTAYSS